MTFQVSEIQTLVQILCLIDFPIYQGITASARRREMTASTSNDLLGPLTKHNSKFV